MDQLEELEKTFIEEYEAGELLLKNQMVKASIIMFSKATFALIDYLIFHKYLKLPKNHTDRFRILEIKEKEIYSNLSKIWSKYTDAYTKPSEHDSVNLFKEFIVKIIQENETISNNIKTIFEK